MKSAYPLLVASAALLLGGCASPPQPPPALPWYLAEPPQDATGWRAAADRAESQQDWPAAAYCMDRWAEADPQAADDAFLERRAGLADRTGEIAAAIAAREALLARRPAELGIRIDLADDLATAGRLRQAMEVLAVEYADAEDQRLAWEAALLIQERAEHPREAAVYAERIARDPGERSARIWWQRASGLYEQAGDLSAATAAIRNALEGVDLRREEERALQRLDAFHRGEPQSTADAVALLRYHPEAEGRLAGLRYLSGREFPDALPAFERALSDNDSRVVRGALLELEKRAPRGRVEALRPLLSHSDVEVQLAAIDALGSLGSEADFPLLYAQLAPEDRARFRAARSALERLTGHVIGVGLDPDLEARQTLRTRWGEWWTGREPR